MVPSRVQNYPFTGFGRGIFISIFLSCSFALKPKPFGKHFQPYIKSHQTGSKVRTKSMKFSNREAFTLKPLCKQHFARFMHISLTVLFNALSFWRQHICDKPKGVQKFTTRRHRTMQPLIKMNVMLMDG